MPAPKRPASVQTPPKVPVRLQRPEKGSIPAKPDNTKVRVQMGYKDINDIVPYEWNARDNAKAVKAVANSIKTFGFLIPVIIDADNVLAAGHTRVEAAKTLGMAEVPFIEASHLTKEQIDAFRIADNKVAEMADWDNTLLADEIARLTGMFDFTDYGFGQGELDCLSALVSDDCLSPANLGALTGEEAGAAPTRSQRRAPIQARYVLGEITFFTTAEQYRNWVQGLRDLHNFDEAAIAEDLKRRLGILE